MLKKIKRQLAESISRATGCDRERALSSLELPKNEFGDLTSKIAFMIAAEEKKNPVQIANDLPIVQKTIGSCVNSALPPKVKTMSFRAELTHEITAKLQNNKSEYVAKIETKGPYINFYFSDEFYAETVEEIVKQKDKSGKTQKAKPKTQNAKQIKVMVEYFHANTHKGVHIGHIRNISIGESLCRILEADGNKVIRANFQGDIGPHVAKCLWGFINIHHEKAPAEDRGIWLGKVYAEASGKIKDNEELEQQVKDINTRLYAGDKKLTELWKKTRQWCLDDFEEFYKEFDVEFDELYFESQTEKIGTQIVKDALKKGIAKEDQKAIVMDLKDDGLGVYILLTKEGYPLYSTKDIGLAKLKFDKYEIGRSIHVVGKEQEYHFKQLFRTFEKLGMKKAAEVSYHLIYDLVMLPEGKMSSREGTMVLYEDLKNKLLDITRAEVKKRHDDWSHNEIEKTAKIIAFAALKFSMVRREHNKIIVFNWDDALNLEGDTGPYLQYAYVRARGILEKIGKTGKNKDYSYNSEERKLIKLLAEFPEVIERSAGHLAPNNLADYLLQLGAAFNKFYAVSPVANAKDDSEKAARAEIVKATGIVLKNGLHLLGIECPERM